MTFRQWVAFFVGTPQRFLACVGVAMLGFGLVFPERVEIAINNLLAALLRAVNPFVEPLLQLAIMIAVIAWFLQRAMSGGRRGGQGGSHR